MIYTWVVNTGQNRSIMTFFELTEGDLVQETGERAATDVWHRCGD